MKEDFRGFSWGSGQGARASSAGRFEGRDLAEEGSWVLDANIQGFFDNLSREWLLKLLQHRVADARILRLIRKWLNAGLMEEGQWKDAEIVTPQGSVISPMLANVYLHYVFDL